MRLFDVKGDRVFDVVAEIITPVANIAEDEKAVAFFKRDKLPKGMTAKRYLLQRVKRYLPALLKDHKEDLTCILAAISGVSPDAYRGALNMPKLAKDFLDLLNDEELLGLFTSAQTEASSGSAQENTEAREA